MQNTKSIYGNCCVLSPNDILMFRCNEKKAKWYLNRGLASIEKNYPLTIKLNFEPNGLGNHNKSYGLQPISNKCVNCGEIDNLTRHHVVPICYRKYFPIEIKSHNFHDVLPMCVTCHENYERKADILKRDLSIKYDAPINGIILNNYELIKYIKMAKALINNKMPKNRSDELKNKIKEKFNYIKLTKKRIRKISSIKVSTSTITHGKIVISKIENIFDFIKMWREHFIENNECKYLPKNWNIKNGI